MSARASLVVVALLAAAQGCRRHRGAARRVRDPRAEYATGCVDPRYVTAPSANVATATDGEVFEVATAAVGALRMLAWSTPGGVSVAPSAVEGVYAWGWARNIWADSLL